ncbi:MAG: hypothetical protein ACKPFA_32090, partial [Dolichospermum sp.]
LIPIFDIDALEEKTQSQDTFGQEDQEIGDTANWYEILTDWVQQLERNPTDDELKKVWRGITDQTLNDDGVKLLRENLGLK